MKPAKVGAAILSSSHNSWQQNNSSQIPLPLRRGSNRGEQDETSDKHRSSGLSRRSHSVKSSILSTTSFCCASGRKDRDDNKTVALRPSKKKSSQRESSHLDRELSDANRKKTKTSNEKPQDKPGDELGNSDEKTRRTCSLSPSHVVPESRYTEVIRTLHKVPTQYTPNNLTSSNLESNKLYAKVGNVKTEREPPLSIAPGKVDGSLILADEPSLSELPRNTVKSIDDLDCPCCTNSNEMDLDKSRISSMDTSRETQRRSLEKETENLLPNTEKQSLQHNVPPILEKEIAKELEELKCELARERYLRKEAERKLLYLAQGCQSRGDTTFLDGPREGELDLTAFGTCYQNLVVTIEAYIKKLEGSNAMLVDNLKKLQDLSPRSQEQEIQLLHAKLIQLEADKQQQKADHECCLDQVANKLVNTLLAQKNAESECQVLHARLEQMRHENTLLTSNAKAVIEVKVDEVEEISCVRLAPDSRNNIEKTFVPEVQSKRPLDVLSTQEKSEFKLKTCGEKQNNTSRIPSRSVLKTSGKKDPFDKTCDESQKRIKIGSNISIPKKPVCKYERNMPTPVSSLTYSEGKTHRSNSDSIKMNPSEPKDMSNIRRKHHVQFARGRSSNVPPIFDKVLCRTEMNVFAPSKFEYSQMDSFTNLSREESSFDSSCSFNSLNLPDIHDTLHLSDLCNNPTDLNYSESVCNVELRPGDDTPIESAEPHRTRDEGYSTMSSDQQQDSTTDATASEQEESLLTYVPPNAYSKFVTDDSVIEGSMTSSSDSGFGPLQQIMIPKCLPETSSSHSESGGHLSETNKATIVRKYPGKKPQSVISEFSDSNVNDSVDEVHQSTVPQVSELLSSENVQENEVQCSVEVSNCRPASLVSKFLTYSGFSEKERISKQTNTSPDIQLSLIRTPVETAEKATLTEPEETLWREKTLAHFIDESIWSLYSSESDTQLRLISAGVVKEFSPLPLPELDSNPATHPGSEETSSCSESQCNSPSLVPQFCKISWEEVAEELHLLDNMHCFLPKLCPFERAASDSGLYLKDVAEQLEEGMKPGLKTSKNFVKNIPLSRRFSDPDIDGGQRHSIDADESIFRDLPLQITATTQASFLSPSSACRSYSWSVCSSSNSCQVSCDEMEDLDADFLPNSKDSQDPNLSSSDVECENLDHNEFVEKWIEKEIPREEISTPEAAKSVDNRCVTDENTFFSYLKTRTARDSYTSPKNIEKLDQNTSSSTSERTPSKKDESFDEYCSNFHTSTRRYPIIFTCENINDDVDEGSNTTDIRLDLQLLDSEVKDFNDDFYHLCDIGSTLSMDHTIPSVPESANKRYEQSKKEISLFQFDESKSTEEKPSGTNTVLLKNSPVSSDKKPEIFIKPLRPATLSFYGVPDRVNFHRFQKREFDSKCPSPIKDKPCSKPIKCTEKLATNNVPVPARKTSKSLRSPNKVQQSRLDRAESMPTSKTNAQQRSKPNSYRTRKSLPLANPSVNRQGDSCHRESYRNKQRPSASRNSTKVQSTHEQNLCFSEDAQPQGSTETADHFTAKEGCGTSWIHVQADASHTDPKVLARLLGSIESSSESGSDNEDRPLVQSNLHLYNLCKEKRKRLKASRADRVVSLSPKHRQSVLNRNSLYYRFSEREKEAISHFDFLEEIPTSSSEPGSLETFIKASSPPNPVQHTKESCLPPPTENRPINWQMASVRYSMSSSTLNSQDVETYDHVSFSDSCAESYTSNLGSSEDMRN